jgi:hypothetical protein
LIFYGRPEAIPESTTAMVVVEPQSPDFLAAPSAIDGVDGEVSVPRRRLKVVRIPRADRDIDLFLGRGATAGAADAAA